MRFPIQFIFSFLISFSLGANNLGSIKISEVRVDSLPPFTDVDYLELTGIADTSLDGLSLVVIGRANFDRSLVFNGGVVNAVIALQGKIPADRAYLIGNSMNMIFDQPDLTADTGLDDLENLSILLVNGVPDFSPGTDLDFEDDGILDDFNFEILDSVSIQWQPIDSPMGGPIYSEVVVGPMGGIVVFGTRRCLATDQWGILEFQYPSVNETPGELGPACLATVCPGDFTFDNSVNGEDLALILGAWGNFDGPYDFDQDGIVGLGDINQFWSYWGACVL